MIDWTCRWTAACGCIQVWHPLSDASAGTAAALAASSCSARLRSDMSRVQAAVATVRCPSEIGGLPDPNPFLPRNLELKVSFCNEVCINNSRHSLHRQCKADVSEAPKSKPSSKNAIVLPESKIEKVWEAFFTPLGPGMQAARRNRMQKVRTCQDVTQSNCIYAF